MSVLTVGSVALDDIETPVEAHKNLLGGSASYAAISASYLSPVQFVGIVGQDFPKEHLDFIKSRNIDLEGLQIAEGKTFRWSGKYFADMNSRETLSIALNVFETFSPILPAAYRETEIVLLANIAPELQHHVLDQTKQPKFVIADTMDLWIDIARDPLLRLLGRIDMLVLNDAEARQLSGESNLIVAGKKIQAMGPKFVALKKGEHGCLLFGDNRFFSCPACPLSEMHDPTGAGDTFAGGIAGYLAKIGLGGQEITFSALKAAVVYGSVLASFNVEKFSLERMKTLEMSEVDARVQELRTIADFEAF